jgi:hypothetical protein
VQKEVRGAAVAPSAYIRQKSSYGGIQAYMKTWQGKDTGTSED